MSLKHRLDTLDALTLEIDALRPIDAEQERRVLDRFRLDWNYNSNAIEGNTLSIGETAALLSYGVTAKGKPFKDHLEMEGHNEVLDHLAELVRNKEPLKERQIRSLHHVLLGRDREVSDLNEDGLKTTRTIAAGRYKTQANLLVTQTAAKRHFALPQETPALMADLIRMHAQRESEGLHPVLIAAAFHHQFVSIHPFDDGNGRMARIVMNLILMQHGYQPAILRLSERNEYLAALVQADEGEFEALFELIADSCLRSTEIFLSAAKGGSVDELQDYDKQLALLTQSVLAEQISDGGKEATPSDQLRVFDSLLAPLFASVIKRLETVKPLFASPLMQIEGKFSPEGLVIRPILEDYAAIVRPMLGAGDKLFVESHLFFQGQSFVSDASKTLVVSVKCSFHPRHYAIQMLASGVQAAEIFRATYDQVITAVDVEGVSRQVLQMIVKAVEHLVAKR